MAGEFGDLLNLDFSSLANAGQAAAPVAQAVGEGNLDVATSMPVDFGSGGFNFSDLASGAKDVAGGIGAGVKGVLDPVAGIAKSVLPVAGLATAGMGIASGIQGAKTAAQQAKIQRDAQRLQQQNAAATQAAAAPLTDFGKQQLEAAKQGQIPAAIQARIEQWKQGALAQARDYMARSGQGNSQAMAQWEAYIDQQAKAMEASYLQEEQRLGIQGLTQGAQSLQSSGSQAGAVAQGAGTEQGAIDNLMKQANEALARLSAGAA